MRCKVLDVKMHVTSWRCSMPRSSSLCCSHTPCSAFCNLCCLVSSAAFRPRLRDVSGGRDAGHRDHVSGQSGQTAGERLSWLVGFFIQESCRHMFQRRWESHTLGCRCHWESYEVAGMHELGKVMFFKNILLFSLPRVHIMLCRSAEDARSMTNTDQQHSDYITYLQQILPN